MSKLAPLLNAEKQNPRVSGGFGEGSLAMTYFRRRGPTIIGADMFHGPVRKGKGWFHVAMVARRNGLYAVAGSGGMGVWSELGVVQAREEEVCWVWLPLSVYSRL